MVDLAIKDYFNKLASQWDDYRQPNSEKIKTILELTSTPYKSNLIDIGAGTGILVNDLIKFKPKRLVALDISNEMINKAKEKYKFQNLELICQDFYKTNLKGFDYAICYAAYPHFLEKELFSNTLKRVLNNKGRFVIAHSESKEKVNGRHNNIKKGLSKILGKVEKEAKVFEKNFYIDILVDTKDYYIISGIKKAE